MKKRFIYKKLYSIIYMFKNILFIGTEAYCVGKDLERVIIHFQAF
jgi:hypothetical protein